LTPEPFLRLRDARKRFGGVLALDGVDLDLGPGEVHGVVGENGAGKSTLMKLLAGAYADYEGELSVGGEPRRFASPADAQAAGIGMVYQELTAFSHLTVAENIFGRHPPTRRGFVSWRATHRIAGQHLSELGLDIDVTSRMGSLPVGTQQLVEIARIIFSGARWIILDEPTSALSPPETKRLFHFMSSLKAQGRGLIFISHFLDDVLEISDRVTVLKNSRRVATLAALLVVGTLALPSLPAQAELRVSELDVFLNDHEVTVHAVLLGAIPPTVRARFEPVTMGVSPANFEFARSQLPPQVRVVELTHPGRDPAWCLRAGWPPGGVRGDSPGGG